MRWLPQLVATKSIEELKAEAGDAGHHALKRVLGPGQLVMLGIGDIIGAGIFVLAGVAAAQYAGPAIILSFLLAAVACSFAALCYSEFAAMLPVSGSAYTYAYATLGELAAWIIGCALTLEFAVGPAAVAVGWSGYVTSLLRDLGLGVPPIFTAPPGTVLVETAPHRWEVLSNVADRLLAQGIDPATLAHETALFNGLAAVVVLVMTAILVVGIQESARVNAAIVVVKVSVIVVFIGACAAFVQTANWTPFLPPNTGEVGRYGYSGILRGAAVVFFAFMGFDSVTAAAQEARNPQRDLPIGIMGSLAGCTVLYVLVAVVLTGVVPYTQLNVPDPIAVGVDATGLRWLSPLIKLGAICGLSTVVLVGMLAQTRIFYTMATDGLLPPWVARIHPRFRTPHLTTIVTGLVVALLAAVTPIAVLGELVSMGTLLIFVIVCAGIIILRRTRPDLPRPFRTPASPLVPLLGVATCAYLMSGLPPDTWLRLLAWMGAGLVIYAAYGRRHSRVRAARGLTVLVLAMMAAGVAVDADAQTCDRLTAVSLANGKVTWARDVAAGAFSPPNGPMAPGTNIFGDLPAFCRFAAILRPSSDSVIQVEVWLPAQGWNGKYLAVGNGAWQGLVSYPAMAEALRRGYATSSTDTGHVGGGASFGMGHPEKVTDFAYRAVHEMTVTAKAVVQAFYGRGAQHAYWNGCSAGGRQAMKAAQMFPADFDGIIAGAPGLDWSGRSAQAVRIAQALQKPEARLTPAALQVLHSAVVAACDGNDGIKDGLIENPAACRFDPRQLACGGTSASGSACLTPPQVESARLIYSPLVDARTKREIPGLAPGSELGWTELGWSLSARATGLDHFRFLVFTDPKWDVAQFNVAADVSRLSDGVSGAIDARDPNLKPFFARGGKLLQYHGWSDPQITPLASTAYYERVAAANGGASAISSSYRLFMAPGMGHCRGGEGPDDFDKIAALERWVEQGQAPDRIVASHRRDGKPERTRPLCPYPQVARYTGAGSIDEAASFVCESATATQR